MRLWETDWSGAEGMDQYKRTIVPWLGFGVRGMAVSRNRILLVRGRIAAVTEPHERQHIRQYRATGFFWPLKYIWLWFGAKCSYRNHPWEKEAREVAYREVGQITDYKA